MRRVHPLIAAGLIGLAGLMITGCALQSAFTVDPGSVPPGTKVARRGNEMNLLGSPLALGQSLPTTALVESTTMQTVDLSKQRGKVLLLSMVHSVDTGL